MYFTLLFIFIFGYAAITMEHTLKIDKLVPALLMMVLSWAVIFIGVPTIWLDPSIGLLIDPKCGQLSIPELTGSIAQKQELIESTLLHHFGKTSEILIFLIGAMTIVEIIDHFDGFQVFKSLIKTKSKIVLLWIICLLAFFLSALIDNLTATIVLISILRKIITDPELRRWYAGFIIIAANSGGAWSPIGDVTTTMLWMNHKVNAGSLITHLFIPALVSILVPLLIASKMKAFKGTIQQTDSSEKTKKQSVVILILGLFLIILVPIIKMATHLPPYMGMMFSLGLISIVAEIISKRQFTLTDITATHSHTSPTFKALTKIELPSILFFLGILMTIAAMESMGMIYGFGVQIQESMDVNVFVTLLGVASAIIDNVPIVAASMGMFQFELDHEIWHFIAYAAGTGGSMLIIGSAAGVVAMGMEKISFFWYLKRITLLAAIGYFAGIAVFLVQLI
ncbi:MAG: sodium:proton antiporter NhaD [Crocinitomicaceae bacterium]|nr:sodium:proton antiporter NhaD [Crocinitomicaceae bacterium]MBP6032231.1 sodium:proton antiporter NhaD [Crocinitomicaceae bacterium]